LTINREERKSQFWNNWDFKTILVVVQLIAVIWGVSATYTELTARVNVIDSTAVNALEEVREELKKVARAEDLQKLEKRLEKIEDYLLNKR
jgi:ABC-type transporter Mla MlaB component